ncbi:profilin, required for normal timing of actin polymerization in response to thermal stress [Sorochytrium milnesiophthora]
MSWQTYVDSNLVGTKKIQKGAIFGHDKSTWATSPDFAVKPQELDTLFQAFKDPSNIRAGGLKIADTKYIALNCNDRSIYAKQGSGGIICVKTKQAVLLGTYDSSTQPGEAVKVVESLADYLISVNY